MTGAGGGRDQRQVAGDVSTPVDGVVTSQEVDPVLESDLLLVGSGGYEDTITAGGGGALETPSDGLAGAKLVNCEGSIPTEGAVIAVR